MAVGELLAELVELGQGRLPVGGGLGGQLFQSVLGVNPRLGAIALVDQFGEPPLERGRPGLLTKRLGKSLGDSDGGLGRIPACECDVREDQRVDEFHPSPPPLGEFQMLVDSRQVIFQRHLPRIRVPHQVLQADVQCQGCVGMLAAEQPVGVVKSQLLGLGLVDDRIEFGTVERGHDGDLAIELDLVSGHQASRLADVAPDHIAVDNPVLAEGAVEVDPMGPIDEDDPGPGAIGDGRVGDDLGFRKDRSSKRQPNRHVVEVAPARSEDEQTRTDLVETTLDIVGLADDQHPVPLERLATGTGREKRIAAGQRVGRRVRRIRPVCCRLALAISRRTRQNPDGARNDDQDQQTDHQPQHEIRSGHRTGGRLCVDRCLIAGRTGIFGGVNWVGHESSRCRRPACCRVLFGPERGAAATLARPAS